MRRYAPSDSPMARLAGNGKARTGAPSARKRATVYAINHPSYFPRHADESGATSCDVLLAIQESVAARGEKVTLRYTDGRAELLSEWCEWESESSYSYRGTQNNDDGSEETWRVVLTES